MKYGRDPARKHVSPGWGKSVPVADHEHIAYTDGRSRFCAICGMRLEDVEGPAEAGDQSSLAPERVPSKE